MVPTAGECVITSVKVFRLIVLLLIGCKYPVETYMVLLIHKYFYLKLDSE